MELYVHFTELVVLISFANDIMTGTSTLMSLSRPLHVRISEALFDAVLFNRMYKNFPSCAWTNYAAEAESVLLDQGDI